MAVRVAINGFGRIGRNVLRAILESGRKDIEVVAMCGDLDSVMDAVDDQRPDVVLTDIRMPPTHTDEGIRLAALLRERHPDVIRLLFTAYADIKAVVDAINQGSVYRYITKPWEPQELQAVLRQAVEHYDLLTGFDGVVVSGEERLAKPDPAIYRLLLDRFSVEPARTFFTDDVQQNVDAARAVGLDAVLFTGAARLRAQLTGREVLPPRARTD